MSNLLAVVLIELVLIYTLMQIGSWSWHQCNICVVFSTFFIVLFIVVASVSALNQYTLYWPGGPHQLMT